MTKICSIVRNEEELLNLESLVDAFIIPLKDYSINYSEYFTVDEMKKIKTNNEIFVSVNRNIHNSEINEFKKMLIELNSLNIKGLIFYDISLINLKDKLNLTYDLVWAQEHLTTNYSSVNYWYEKGAKYAYLSSEITKAEIKEIIENTKSKLFLNVFGYVPIFTSRRHLVKSYLETFDLGQSSHYSLFKEGKTYPIVDAEKGTTVYSNYILNILGEIKELDIDYMVFNPFNIDKNKYLEVIKNYKKNKGIKFPKELGFLDKETIYKVKKND